MRVAAADSAAMLKRWRWVFLCSAVFGTMVGLVVAGLISRLMPEVHEGAVTIEVLPENPGDSPAYQKPVGVAPEEHVEPWIVTEIENITDRDALEAVIGSLDLHQRWRMDRENAVQVLERSVSVRSLRGTPVVAIRVRHPDGNAVGRIARELAVNHKERRLEIGKRAAEQMAGKLRTAIRDQEQKVDECRMELAEVERTMKKNLNIGGTETLLHIPESREHAEARREMASAEGLLHVMKIKLLEQDNWGGAADYRLKALEDLKVSTAVISPDAAAYLTTGAALGLLFSPLATFMGIRSPDRKVIAG